MRWHVSTASVYTSPMRLSLHAISPWVHTTESLPTLQATQVPQPDTSNRLDVLHGNCQGFNHLLGNNWHHAKRQRSFFSNLGIKTMHIRPKLVTFFFFSSVQCHKGPLHDAGGQDGEIELDMDALSRKALWALHELYMNSVPAKNGPPRKGGGGGRSGTPGAARGASQGPMANQPEVCVCTS